MGCVEGPAWVSARRGEGANRVQRPKIRRRFLVGLAVAWVAAAGIQGQAQAQGQTPDGRPGTPAVSARGGRKSDFTITATRIVKPIVLDGRLDDEVYQQVIPSSGFLQQEPREGMPTSEQTDVWVFFDGKALYISARCVDSQPEREVVTELRRDNVNVFQNDNFSVVLDTFNDQRNGFMFQTNPLGAVRDQAIVDDVNIESWNAIWDVRTNRSKEGWTLEIEIPFKSLRYSAPGAQIWGINFRRIIKWKNEIAHQTAMPASLGGTGLSRMDYAGTLLGVEAPAQSMNLEVKPYAVSSLTTDRAAKVPFSNDGKGNAGFDFKYGLTRGLILDATFNTDFAQVEEDQQQVNLTRFSLFFPEKRDFFLEGQGVFAFGGGNQGNNGNPGEVPIMFFSRQIGLSKGQEVPVLGGTRLTGRSGRYQIGAVNIQTKDKPSAGAVATNFTAVRIKRDILRRSNMGVIATRRSPRAAGAGDNLLLGVDTNLFLFRGVTANAYYARSDSPRRDGDQTSYRGRFEFSSDRHGYTAEHLLIGPQFNPEVGYTRRTDFRRNFGQFRFSPRPRNSQRVRKYSYTGSVDYVTDAGITLVQEKELRGQFNVDYQNGDSLNVDYTRNYERLSAPFAINPGSTVAAGGYNYQNVRVQYSLGPQRTISGRVAFARGSLYNGTKTEASYSGRIGPIPQLALEPSVSLNWVRLPDGEFSAPVTGSRIIFTPNARTALSSLIQYNRSAHTLSSSVRLRWEYRGGSELFIVYSDGRNTLGSGYPKLLNRSVAVKITRLLRF